jgi:hypothetical protein
MAAYAGHVKQSGTAEDFMLLPLSQRWEFFVCRVTGTWQASTKTIIII